MSKLTQKIKALYSWVWKIKKGNGSPITTTGTAEFVWYGNDCDTTYTKNNKKEVK